MSQHFVPHPHQRETKQRIIENRRCGIWLQMGGGKSAATIDALLDLDVVEDVFPVLILAPKRVVESTWPEEIRKWKSFSHLRVSVVSGTAKERAAALKAPADIYCCAYDNLVWLVETAGKENWPFRTVVADEASRLKSFRLRQGSKRAAALGKVAHSKVDRFIGLTGTPAANGLRDLWGSCWFIDHGERLGRTFSSFEQRWFRRGFDGFSLEPMPHAQGEIEALLKDVCFTIKGLPVDEPITNKIYVDLPRKARDYYYDMEKEFFIEIAEQGVEAVNAAVKSGKLSQLANGAIYLDENGTFEEVHTAKLGALESVLEEAAGTPVLVSYQFKSDLERILKRFKQAKHLDADPKTIKRWNAGEIPMLVAHPKSAGHGLNLQDGGNILCFFGMTWALEDYQQIIERIGPQRQKQAGYDRPVFVHHILARNTVDDMMFERLESKRSVQDILLEALRRRG